MDKPFKTINNDLVIVNWYELPLTKHTTDLGWSHRVKKVKYYFNGLGVYETIEYAYTADLDDMYMTHIYRRTWKQVFEVKN